MRPRFRLVTIPISHYCEKARWALDRAGIDYVEEGHPPLVHRWHTRSLGRVRSTPQLVGPGVSLPSSAEIVRFADRGRDELFPVDEATRASVEAWMRRLDDELGPHVRRFAYHPLLPRKDLVLPLFVHGVPRHEARLVSLAYTPIAAAMRRAMRIDARGAARSWERIVAVLDDVDAALADGRPYLLGERFTAADLTLAALLGPLVMPPSHPLPLPRADALPDALRHVVESLRLRPAGALVLRAYENERTHRPST